MATTWADMVEGYTRLLRYSLDTNVSESRTGSKRPSAPGVSPDSLRLRTLERRGDVDYGPTSKKVRSEEMEEGRRKVYRSVLERPLSD